MGERCSQVGVYPNLIPEFDKIKIVLQLFYFSSILLSYSQEVINVGVCSIPAANLRIGQVLILVLSSHIEWRQEIVTEHVPPGMDPRLARNALRRTIVLTKRCHGY